MSRSQTTTQKIDSRLASVEGHIKAVRKMLVEDKGCIEVITQLMAIEKAVKKAGIEMLKAHFNTCVVEGAKKGDVTELLDLDKLLEMYL